jgi:hypothetical protein
MPHRFRKVRKKSGAAGTLAKRIPNESKKMVRLARNALFHIDFHAHPRVDAALKEVFTL